MIRKFENKDTDRVMEIWLEANLQAHDFISREYWLEHKDETAQLLPKASVYVYEDEEGIQAFIGMVNNYIAGIFVATKMQGKGIGKRLLDHVKTIQKYLTLHVYQKNTGAIGFYQREGFGVLTIDIDTATGEREYTMCWAIDDDNIIKE